MPNTLVIKSDILNSVEDSCKTPDGFSIECIKVSFKNHPSRYLDKKNFNKDPLNMSELKRLIGEEVRVFAWDPPGRQGTYSNKFWFSKIIAVSALVEEIPYNLKTTSPNTNHKMIQKGKCIICGIEDNMVGYSENFGKNWMHYRCRFPEE